MANKERNKRSARKARAEERAQREAVSAAATSESSAKVQKAEEKKQEKSMQRSAHPGFFGRLGAYFAGVRTEMHRVVWPSGSELAGFSVAVIATIVLFGLVTWLVDTGIVAGLVAFTGLRG